MLKSVSVVYRRTKQVSKIVDEVRCLTLRKFTYRNNLQGANG